MSLLRHSASIYKGFYNATTSIPFASDALFWLDGSISGNEFVDFSGNSRNFTITGKDFDDDWMLGFPYKSIATISAPVGDAVLIAADINNFLYDAGGDPNTIPVVSFFQDIDYGHKLFCRHVDQITDVNGVETYEPRVLDIVLYNNVKSGSDLTSCQNYYNVPTEILSAVSVPGDYATNTAAIAGESAGQTIYNKTGTKVESSNFFSYKELDFIGLGYSVNDYTGTPSSLVRLANGAALVEGLIFNGKDTIALGIRAQVDNCIIKRTKLYGVATGSRMIQEGSTGLQLLNCLFLGSQTQTYFISERSPDLIINGCYISGKYSQAMFGLAATSADTQTFIYNKLVLTGSATYTILSAAIELNFNYNNVTIENLWVNFAGMQTADSVLNMKYNIFSWTGTTQNANSSLIFSTFPDSGTLNLHYNRLDSVDGLGQVINHKMKDASVIGNYTRLQSSLMQTEVTNSADYENNTIASWGDVDDSLFTGIVVSSAVGELDLSVIIQKNKVLNGRHFNIAYGGQHGCIYVRDYINAVIKYNYSSGAGIASIIYKSTVAMTSTEAPLMYNINVLSGIWSAIGGTKIYGNTVVDALTQGIKLVGADDVSDISSNTVKNNIVVNGINTDLLVDVVSEKVADVHIFDYNIYYSEAAKPFKHKGTTKTFAEWQALGYDANSIFLTEAQFNNLFTDYNNGDYSLKSGSLAIGSGENLGDVYKTGLNSSTNWGDDTELPTVVTKDQSGDWDIGAYIN
jgi:hypothetical protein